MLFPLIELGVLVVLGIIMLYCLIEITTRQYRLTHCYHGNDPTDHRLTR